MRTWPALRLSGLSTASLDPQTSTADLVHAALTDFPVAAIEEVSADEWQVFFATSDERQDAGRAVARLFPAVSVADTDVPDEDWAARSQASLRAIRAGRILVAPPWDTGTQPDLLTIVIQPSMGFGTGHHATTRLCLEKLQTLTLAGRRVVDVGTGSGVLAIAASLLGASTVVGIDDDADAVQAAQENLALNDGANVRFVVADLRTFSDAPFDILTANLTGGLLAAAAPQLLALAGPGGTLILSGIMTSEAAGVLTHFGSCDVIERADEDEWVCVTLERRVNP